MTELKTLKDFEPTEDDPSCTYCNAQDQLCDELRREAIKWIKEFQKSSIETELVVTMSPNHHYTHGMRCGAILLLKEFFNITKEDLK